MTITGIITGAGIGLAMFGFLLMIGASYMIGAKFMVEGIKS